MVGAHENLNGLRDLTTPLSGIVWNPLASTCYDESINQPNLMSLSPPTPKIWQAIQNVENEVVWGS